MKPNLIAPCASADTYRLNGITYLPHYVKATYVAPGHIERVSREYTAQELIAAGATVAREVLLTGGALRGK